MAKKFFNTRCVHCCQYFEILTSDHVFPSSWYPTGTPVDIEKWQAPSCSPCNKDIGKIENELLLKFGLCLSSEQKTSVGIPQKTLNALDPSRGKNDRDSLARKNKKNKILREIIPKEEVEYNSVIPNNSNGNTSKQEAIRVSKEHIDIFIIKLIKGITWVDSGKLLCEKHKIDVKIPRDINDNPLTVAIKTHGSTSSFGDGIKISKLLSEDEPLCGIYEITLWGTIVVHGIVTINHGDK